MSDLEAVITEAVEDATLPTDTDEALPAPEGDQPVEAAPDAAQEVPTDGVAPADGANVHKPVEKDDFETRWGIPAQTMGGRENRIPYSRVKKITSNAERELAELALGRKFTKEELAKKGFKAHDFVKEHVGRIPTMEAKLKDYEDRFQRVQKFENIMVNEPEKFVEMLATLPAYKPFFDAIEKAFQIVQNPQFQQHPQGQQQQQNPTDDMPQPDELLPDGSRVYSLEGLAKRDAWNRAQAKKEIMEEVQKTYGPLVQEREAAKRYNSAAQVVHTKIAEARTWEHFNDNEEEITKALQRNPSWSLERAYNHVVLPKYKADRQKMREEILAELKTAPKSTAAPAGSTKPTPTPESKRSLEDVIKDSIKHLK